MALEDGELQDGEGEGMEEDEGEEIMPTQVVEGFTQDQQQLLQAFLPTSSLQEVKEFLTSTGEQPVVLLYLLRKYLPEDPKEVTQESVNALAELLWKNKEQYVKDFEQYQGNR